MCFGGVDLGASNVRAVVTDDDGAVLGDDDRPTPQGPDGSAVSEAILGTLRAAADDAGVAPERIDAAGIGSIGPLDLATGTIENPSNLPDGIGTIELTGPVADLIDSDRVHLHNDTNAGVIGERFFSDRNPADMAYITISSGIGAGVCVDGTVLGGWDGNAGEVGHYVLDPDGRLTCGCGQAGHWEAYCSGDNIPRFARHLHEHRDVETDLPLDDPQLTAAQVLDAAREDPLADLVVEEAGHVNAMGVTNVVHSYAPIVIYVGGAVALNNPDLTLDPIRERLDDMLFTNRPELKLTTLGESVVVKGAVASAMTRGTGDPAQRRT